MKTPTLLLLLLTLLTATLTLATASPGGAGWGGDKASSDWGKAACAKRAPYVQRAIELFCRPRNGASGFMVPGAAANSPKQFGNAVYVRFGRWEGGEQQGLWEGSVPEVEDFSPEWG
ncbi:hypothetical protein Q7P36_007361 [Cladosporium allicinum]